jgi:hypothetical protein
MNVMKELVSQVGREVAIRTHEDFTLIGTLVKNDLHDPEHDEFMLTECYVIVWDKDELDLETLASQTSRTLRYLDIGCSKVFRVRDVLECWEWVGDEDE